MKVLGSFPLAFVLSGSDPFSGFALEFRFGVGFLGVGCSSRALPRCRMVFWVDVIVAARVR